MVGQMVFALKDYNMEYENKLCYTPFWEIISEI